MLGGTEVIISGPCFESSNARVACRFDKDQVNGVVLSDSLALCTAPEMTRAGLVPFEMEYDENTYTSTFFLVSVTLIDAVIMITIIMLLQYRIMQSLLREPMQ